MEPIFNEFHRIIEKINNNIGWSEEKILKKSGSHPSIKLSHVSSNGRRNYEELCFPECSYNENSVQLTDDQLKTLANNPLAQAPEKFSDLQLNFNREQKLSIYEFVTSKCKKSTEETLLEEIEWKNFMKISQGNKAARRRRRKHRKTKVTYKEEIRALIELHMKALNLSTVRFKKKPTKLRNDKNLKDERKSEIETSKVKASNDKVKQRCKSKSRSPLSAGIYSSKLQTTTDSESSTQCHRPRKKATKESKRKSRLSKSSIDSPPRHRATHQPKSRHDRFINRSPSRECKRRNMDSPPPYRSRNKRKRISFRRSRSSSSFDRYDHYIESYD